MGCQSTQPNRYAQRLNVQQIDPVTVVFGPAEVVFPHGWTAELESAVIDLETHSLGASLSENLVLDAEIRQPGQVIWCKSVANQAYTSPFVVRQTLLGLAELLQFNSCASLEAILGRPQTATGPTSFGMINRWTVCNGKKGEQFGANEITAILQSSANIEPDGIPELRPVVVMLRSSISHLD